MTLHQLKIFAAVAKVGSFTQVAKNLRLSQPSVSLLIQGLRRELGVKLFEMLGVKPHLTEAGRRVLQLAEGALALIEKIPEEVEEVKGLKKGRIKVGGSAIASATFLPMVIQAFKKNHPGVDVIFKMQSSDNLERQLLAGELDVAITGRAPISSLIVTEPYYDEEICAITAPNHPLTRKRSVSLELLAKEPLITTPKGYATREMVERKFAEKGFLFRVALEVDIQAGIRDAIKSGVASGIGIGFISKSAVLSDIKAGRLKMLRVPELMLKKTQYIATHKNRPNNPLVQAFIEVLRSYRK